MNHKENPVTLSLSLISLNSAFRGLPPVLVAEPTTLLCPFINQSLTSDVKSIFPHVEDEIVTRSDSHDRRKP